MSLEELKEEIVKWKRKMHYYDTGKHDNSAKFWEADRKIEELKKRVDELKKSRCEEEFLERFYYSYTI